MTSSSQISILSSSNLPSLVYSTGMAAQKALQVVLEQTIDVLHLKKRHVLTKGNRLRLRYLVSGAAGLALVMGLHAGGQIDPQSSIQTEAQLIASLDQENDADTTGRILSLIVPQHSIAGVGNILSLDNFRDDNGQIRRDREVLRSMEMMAEDETSSPGDQEKTIEIGQGDTLSEILTKAGLGNTESQTVTSEIGRHFNLRGLRPGQKFSITLEPAETDSGYQLSKLSFSPDPLRTIEVARNDNGDLISRIDEKEIQKQHEARLVSIDGSVYGSADKANLPDRITANTIRLFSYAVDFQRDIHQGDKMEVMYDSYKTEDGYLAKTGDIIFARMTLGDRQYAFYRYETLDGQVDYFTEDGKSIRKSAGLMKTPVAYGRVSSGYGMRRHPILGYSKMHKGMDFAAPTGTKIFAAGDGVIERVGRFGAYGNYVRIRHSSKLSTAYGHMSKFAKGLHSGMKVKQGQLIGYVGTTGRSTGPHLHYEVMVNGVQVNPKSVKVTVDNSLKGKDLKRFKDQIKKLDGQYVQNLDPDSKINLASNE